MQFSKVIGQQHVKQSLTEAVANGRISHAQLFLGLKVMALYHLPLRMCNTCSVKTALQPIHAASALPAKK